MIPPAKSLAGGARRPDRAVIVRRELDAAPVPPARVGSAGAMSAAFHAALFVLFVLLAPRGHSFDVVETSIAVVEAEDAIEKEAHDFLSTHVDPFAKAPGERTYDTPRLGEVSIPGEAAVGEPGLRDGSAEAPLATVPPPPGFGPGTGSGAALGDGPAMPRAVGPAGGEWYRPGMPGRLGAGGITTKQFAEDGGTTASEAAVAKGLGWLARTQSPNGVWKLDGAFPDKGNPNDAAGTAFGLLPFLAAGKTHKLNKNNPYDRTVERGLAALISLQDKRSGAFSRDMYAHGLATIALCEAFALSQDYSLKKPAQLAINYIVKAQHDGGGWRYSPGQAGDTSVSGWQIMALKSGLMAGLDVPSVTLRRAQAYLDGVVAPSSEGYGYTGPQPTPTMTAVALLCRQYLNGWGGQNFRLIKGVDNHLKPNGPRPDKKDSYYYYYATQVMHNLGGDDWKKWNAAMRDQLIASQDSDAKQVATYGSWSPAGDLWGRQGGRLMVTSLNLLTLEVYYRYLPLYYREKAN